MSKVFISYRREDTAGYAISLHDRLADRFGADQIFMDIDNIEPGEDFTEVINEKVSACDVLLVLIGRDWLTCRDEFGRRRLDNHDDFVRLEVVAALDRKIRVIPVLVGGAKLPKPDELPPELASLCRRNAAAITDVGFRRDANGLIEGIERVIKASGTPHPRFEQQSQPFAKNVGESARPSPVDFKTGGAGDPENVQSASTTKAIRLGKLEQIKFWTAKWMLWGPLCGAMVGLILGIIDDGPRFFTLELFLTWVGGGAVWGLLGGVGVGVLFGVLVDYFARRP